MAFAFERFCAKMNRTERGCVGDQPQHTRLFNTLRLVPFYPRTAALRALQFMVPMHS